MDERPMTTNLGEAADKEADEYRARAELEAAREAHTKQMLHASSESRDRRAADLLFEASELLKAGGRTEAAYRLKSAAVLIGVHLEPRGSGLLGGW
jgi:hypothetical protein